MSEVGGGGWPIQSIPSLSNESFRRWSGRLSGRAVVLCVLFTACFIGLIVAAWNLARISLEDTQARETFDSLEGRMQSVRDEGLASELGVPTLEGQVLPEFEGLLAENADFIGWVSVPDTPVSYPVMQSVDDPDFYLEHDFFQQPSIYGTPYLAADCSSSATCNNLIVYGHNIDGSQMFAPLLGYVDEAFYADHSFISFDTLSSRGLFEVVAVVVLSLDEVNHFRFYEYSQLNNAEQFEHYISSAKSKSVINTDVTPEFGEHLLTLVTCDFSIENGRLLVIAREIP